MHTRSHKWVVTVYFSFHSSHLQPHLLPATASCSLWLWCGSIRWMSAWFPLWVLRVVTSMTISEWKFLQLIFHSVALCKCMNIAHLIILFKSRTIFLRYTLLVKHLEKYIFRFFLQDVFYAHQGCIYLIRNTVKTVILWNNNNILNSCIL